MSFDYFAQGIPENAGIKFTQQQQMFFKSKLMFLDPEGKKSIPLGQAISLLKFAGLAPGVSKKIFDNLKLTGKSTLDYTEMKKVLRGVALAQNSIQPSKINIEANIKTKLPQFHDDDSSQQQEPPKPPSKQEPIKTTTQSVPKPVQVVSNPAQQPISQNDNYAIQVSKSPPLQQPVQDKKTSELNKNIKKFDDFWQTLTTQQGVKISGNEVKKLFGKSQNRKQLSKIWKICNNAYKGSLSKGQLYVFVTLMKMKSPDIPSELTQQMKQIIKKIDSENPHKQKVSPADNMRVSRNAFDFDKSQQVQKHPDTLKTENKTSGTANRMSTSAHDFDDFANFGNPKPKPKPIEPTNQFREPQAQKPPPPQAQPQPQPQQRPQPVSPPKTQPLKLPQPPQQIHTIPKQTIQTTYTTTQRQIYQLANEIIPQLQSLSQQNKQSTVILQQTNQFLNNIDQAHQYFVNKINEMKIAQDQTNHRLNQTCIRMRDVIMKQSQLINSMVGDLEKEIDMGKERVGVLQAYAQNIEGQVNDTVNKVNKIHQTKSNPQHAEHIIQSSNRISINQNDHHEGTTQIYNRKSMQSMRQMTESMAVRKPQHTPTNHQTKQHDQSQQVQPSGGVYRQKLMQQLREQQRLHVDNRQQSNPTINQNKSKKVVQSDGYHWDVGQRVQFTNQHTDKQQSHKNFKKTDSQQQEQDQDEKMQRLKQQQLLIQQQQQQLFLKQQQQQQELLRAQQQQQAQQQAQLLAQQQAQQQAQLQAQQAAALQQQQQKQQEGGDEQAIRNLKMKQARLIQMIHYLSPISQETYPVIVQRIISMTESVIDATYAQLYQRYLIKVEEEQQKAQTKGQKPNIVAMPNQDQFSSNNFKNAEQPQKTNFF